MVFGKKKWQIRRDEKQQQRHADFVAVKALVKSYHGLSDPLRDQILNATSPDLVHGIATKQWTSTQVLMAFVERVVRMEDLGLGAVSEYMVYEAFERAKGLDENFERTGELVGMCHGLPITVKDCFHVRGYDATIGLTNMAGVGCTSNDPAVQVLLDQGANPFLKTNVPQTMFSFECSNPLFGKTVNPRNRNRTCGGSSGGEAALISSDCSPVGIGTDIGGSLRIPAAYSGCFSLKPTPMRFPLGKETITVATPGFEGVRTSSGPLGRSVDDVEFLAKAGFEGAKRMKGRRLCDTIPMGWNESVLPKKLKFGYMYDDGLCRSSPANRRAIDEAVQALRLKGHDVVELKMPDAWRGIIYFLALATAAKYRALHRTISDDPLEDSMFIATLGPRIPTFLRYIIVIVLLYILKDPKASELLRVAGGKTSHENERYQQERTCFVESFRRKLWEEYELDGFLVPCLATPAVAPGDTKFLAALCSLTVLFNVVESAVGVVPVTFVDKEKDKLPVNFLHEVGEKGTPMMETRVYGKGGIYNAEKMHGLPIGIQIVGPQFEDEKVLGMMRVVDDALGERGFGPGEYRDSGAEDRLQLDDPDLTLTVDTFIDEAELKQVKVEKI